MPDDQTLDELATEVATCRASFEAWLEHDRRVSTELETARCKKFDAEAALGRALARLVDSKAGATGRRPCSTLHLHVAGKRVAESVAKHTEGGSDDYRH